jgi:hypothetical protein
VLNGPCSGRGRWTLLQLIRLTCCFAAGSAVICAHIVEYKARLRLYAQIKQKIQKWVFYRKLIQKGGGADFLVYKFKKVYRTTGPRSDLRPDSWSCMSKFWSRHGLQNFRKRIFWWRPGRVKQRHSSFRTCRFFSFPVYLEEVLMQGNNTLSAILELIALILFKNVLKFLNTFQFLLCSTDILIIT